MALLHYGNVFRVGLSIICRHDKRIGIVKSLSRAQLGKQCGSAAQVDAGPFGSGQPQLIAVFAKLLSKNVKDFHNAADTE